MNASILPFKNIFEINSPFKGPNEKINKNKPRYLDFSWFYLFFEFLIKNKYINNTSIVGEKLVHVLEIYKNEYKNLFVYSIQNKKEKKQLFEHIIMLQNKIKTNKYVSFQLDYFPMKGMISFIKKNNKFLIHSSQVKGIHESKSRFIIFNLTLYNFVGKHTVHANSLIIDKTKKTIERYDPHGTYNTNTQYTIDRLLQKHLQILFPTYTYIFYTQLLPCTKGPQYIVNMFGGMCQIWSFILIHLKVTMPNTSINIIINNITKSPKEKIIKLLNNYSKYVIKIVNNIDIDSLFKRQFGYLK